jgi:hypothetical protein
VMPLRPPIHRTRKMLLDSYASPLTLAHHAQVAVSSFLGSRSYQT